MIKQPHNRKICCDATPWRRARAVATVALSVLLLAACTTTPTEEAYVEKPVAELYNSAMAFIESGNYFNAARKFDEVERQHPYSTWATKAQLMAAYSHYQINEYDDAIVSLDRYIQLHPSNPDAPYAYYLKGLCYYEQISDVGRDQRMTELALKTLKELVARFPNSVYARDANLKLDLTTDHLAGKEMEVGRYYLNQEQYLAAINRFRNVVTNYETTTHVPEALHRLTDAYTALGMTAESQKAAAVLGHNCPGSDWYVDSFELMEGVDMRPPADRTWYPSWFASRRDPTPKPLLPLSKAPPWYKFWSSGGSDQPRATNPANAVPQPGTIAQPATRAATKQPAQAGKTPPPKPATAPTQAKDEPWYKFW